MKIVSRSTSLSMVLASTLALTSLVGCSKNHDARIEPQTEPMPNPTSTAQPSPRPSPMPSPTPSPHPSPTPIPNPSPTPVACDPSALKEFAKTSSFAATTAKFEGMNVSHGVIAPTLALDGVDLGYGLPIDGGRYDVVGDRVDLRSVTVESGGVAYGASVKFHEDVDVFGVVKKTAPIDYAAATAGAIALRARLVAMAPNGSVTVTCPPSGACRALLKGTNPTVNRFTMTVAEMSRLKRGARIVVDVPKRSAAVVVLQATSVTFDDIEVDSPPETVWTLAGPGGTFKIDFITLTGTVLLPESNFEMSQALLMGRAVSKTFASASCRDGACATIDSQEMPDAVCL